MYRIKVSGTSENSLFTNFPYLQRNIGEFEIVAEEKSPLIIREIDNEDSDGSPPASVSESQSQAQLPLVEEIVS